MSSFITTLSLQNELLNSHERFFFTKIQPYQVLTFIRTTLWAFTLTLWCIPFCIRKFILKKKSWRHRLVLISDSDSTSRITPEMIFRFPTTNKNPLFADLCNRKIHTPSWHASAKAIYFVSVYDNATHVCFLHPQMMDPPISWKR